MNVRSIVTGTAIYVAEGNRESAARLVRDALNEARNGAEPRLKVLEGEVAKLKQALVCFYSPTQREQQQWRDHCDEIWAAGGTPPDEDEWRVELALAELERRE